jgi:hypothetical protein
VRVVGGPCDGDHIYSYDFAEALAEEQFLIARARRAQTEGWA